MNGTQLLHIVSAIPGPSSRLQVETLASHECPAITARRGRRATTLAADNDDPIVWKEAVGANVRDTDGNIFVDLTSGFGVALAGHRHPTVVAAAEAQLGTLIHASGDAWPDEQRISLLQRLAGFSPEGLDVVILGSSGADAVEAAIKTALLTTGKPGIVTFEGSYHGLSLGTLPLQAYRTRFSAPFSPHLSPHITHLAWGCEPADLERTLTKGNVGLVLAEPIQGRGGIRPAPAGWLAEIAAITRAQQALFGLDEIQTGLGRTGARFACEDEGVIPDLMCVGKALGGGFPISACLGTNAVMQTWGVSTGEAIHTQTFLGHPVGCAAGLAMLDLLEGDLLQEVRRTANLLASSLQYAGFTTRGRGLMLGVRAGPSSLAVARKLLQQGFLVLPAGSEPDILGLTPPACLTQQQIGAFVSALSEAVA